jgi:maltose O-acetyltransferase
MIGPGVQLLTACHPIDAAERNTLIEYAKPIVINDNVWIGGGVIITPGVTIGMNSIIGAGSVVTKDIPGNVIAAGNPCRVIREI